MLCTNYIGKYIGKPMFGFQTDHMYSFSLSNDERTYTLEATEDLTDGENCNFYCRYSSEKSIKRNWEICNGQEE